MDLNKQEVEIMQKNYNDLLLTYHSKDYEKLLLDSISFCKKYPKNIYGFNVLALAYKNVGNYEKSIDLFEKMMATNPLETSIYTNAGNTYHAIGRMTKSFECHRKALEIDPNCIGSMNGCGLALADGGKEDEAIEYYKENSYHSLKKNTPQLVTNNFMSRIGRPTKLHRRKIDKLMGRN